ncbi:ATP-binding cassette sub-family A member 2-like [Tubulanus polymorphus]|uniref:ATP-binding cassette sub-family A member 2-like n=1 Tax=Tubulanus polymorphus TaxID=672921 RepID=UPI003DA5458C
MGFFLQLRILLWKNFTLKKRSPFVLMFEVFIPLVLFFILVAIRAKQPSSPRKAVEFHTLPLPSSGVLSVMQAFCDNGEINKDGFVNFPQSSMSSFLTHFKNIAKDHNFFDPGFEPDEMDKIPKMYKQIFDEPVEIQDLFKQANNFTLDMLFEDKQQVMDFLVNNLSLPIQDAKVLMNVTINMNELNRLLFQRNTQQDTRRTNLHKLLRTVLDLVRNPKRSRSKRDARRSDALRFSRVKDLLSETGKMADVLNRLPKGSILSTGADRMRAIMEKLSASRDEERRDERELFSDMLGFSDDSNMNKIVDLIKNILLSPDMIHEVSCDKDELNRLLIPPDDEDSVVKLNKTEDFICHLNSTQLTALSNELKTAIKTTHVVKLFHLDTLDFSKRQKRVKEFIENVHLFMLFEKQLFELSTLAAILPLDSCPHPDSLTPITDAPPPSSNSSDSNTNDIKNETSSSKPEHREKKKDSMSQYATLMKIWTTMQRTVCGKDTNITLETEKFKRNPNSRQQRDLRYLLYALNSNLKVLYAPNNSKAVDSVIKQANQSFALINEVTQYADKWLNISNDLRQYFLENSTKYNLEQLRLVQLSLRENVVAYTDNPDLVKFANFSIPSADDFLRQLERVDNASCSWKALMKNVHLNMWLGFETEDDVIDYALKRAYNDHVTVLAGLVFEVNKDGSLPNHVTYKIRQNASLTASTKLIRPQNWNPGPRGAGQDFGYYKYGFLWLQDAIERAIIDVLAGRDVVEPGTYLHQFPYPCFFKDQFLVMIEHVMPLCLTISWVYSVAMLVQSIVYEKEQRLKEVMKMMGLSNAVHWIAWFITSFGQMTLTMGMLTIMLKYGHVLEYSNPFIIFIVLEVFALATIMFCFFVSVLYSKAKLAAACAGIMYFLSYVPYMYVAIREEAARDHISAWAKSIASLFSTTAFGIGAKYFAYYEEQGIGVQWDNLAVSPVEDDKFNLFSVTLMMIIDATVYGLLVWYIEAVHPGSFGLPKPWYFPFTKSYWCGHPIKTEPEQQCSVTNCFRRRRGYMSVVEEDQACAMDQRTQAYNQNFEAEPTHIPLGVSIDDLTKIYKTGKLAVNKLSLNLYEGQITSFLGHNGAGKTTTMSILTGFFPPTSGSATIYGLNIRTEMEEIRKSLGMCPQHNVLFDKLTVEEHLWFYARLKGMQSKDIDKEMESMIKDVGLPKKRKNTVDCLSGGMQRKLSVAIAFVAGSRTVILDEPTAGVDPYARRAIWDLLIKYKKGRTILLSTHHMDEADILGDRIAIISNGQLKCCGSSLFLKSTFGEGYHLKLVKKPVEEDLRSTVSDTLSQDSATLLNLHRKMSFVSLCTEDKATDFITKYVSTAYLHSETSRELHYILPFEEAKKGNFEKLFEALDSSKAAEAHISSYGVIDTNLEEVFLHVTEKAKNDEDDAENEDVDPGSLKSQDSTSVDNSNPMTDMAGDDDVPLLTSEQTGDVAMEHMARAGSEESLYQLPRNNESRTNGDYSLLVNEEHEAGAGLFEAGSVSHTLSGSALRLRQFYGVLIKRMYYVSRNWKGLFSQIILPAMFVCIAMTVALTAPLAQDLPPLVMSPAQYYNYTQRDSNIIPYATDQRQQRKIKTEDAQPGAVIDSLLNYGISATCILKTPFQNPFDSLPQVMNQLERLDNQQKWDFLSAYFNPGCRDVFVQGFHLSSYMPPSYIIPAATEKKNASQEAHMKTIQEAMARFYPECRCAKDGRGFLCPSYYKRPPAYKALTNEKLLDITGQNEPEYFLNTHDEYRLNRYGAITSGYARKFVPEDFAENAPGLFRRLAVRDVSKVWYNDKGYHSMPAYLNTINNAILRANLPVEKGNPAAYGITLINHPINNTNNQLSMDYILQGSDVLISIFIIVAMSFVPASFVLFLVYERHIKAKHLQFVSGVNPIIYWSANYFWDMCNYVIPAGCCIIILKIFDIPAYVSGTNFPATVSLFLLYGWSITPMMYPASFKFKEPSTAYICLIVINLFVGITCIVTSFLLEMFSYDSDLRKIHKWLKMIFLMFPNYCLGRGLMDIAFNEYHNEYYFKTGQFDRIKSPFGWELMSRNLVAMAVMGMIFFIITLLCEYKFFLKPRKCKVPETPTAADEDADVSMERKRVLRGSGRRDMLRIENLTKVYNTKKLGNHLAVDKICLGVSAGECFGLLGVNGAGKTTTFKMLTGDILPSSGNAHLSSYSILADMLKVQQHIGYCPQFDALYDELTAREHLQLYARLRGIPPSDEKRVVNWALNKLTLTPYADKQSKTYSGGNKRKLSTAIALIGHPPAIFLDEPTTGMDPHSRRFLWDLILDLIRNGRCIILTSHSMEECEALCTRLAIMVNGQFKCLGSVQHLKSRFGDGYSVTVRVKGPNYDREVEAIKRFIERKFSTAVLKEQHHNMVQYELSTSGLSLAQLFSKMEEASRDLQVEDYSVCQNTLDNVFINFVKQQAEIANEIDHGDVTPSGSQTFQNRRSEQLEDSDDELLGFESGTRLAFLSPEPQEMDI